MNEWIKKSIKIANSAGYLDRLQEIYPIVPSIRRRLALSLKEKIRESFESKDEKELIKILLSLERFPFKDPYIAFFRADPKFLDLNPGTVHRIANQLFRMGLTKIFQGACTPKEANTRIGPLFRKWIPQLGFPILPKKEFDKYDKDSLQVPRWN